MFTKSPLSTQPVSKSHLEILRDIMMLGGMISTYLRSHLDPEVATAMRGKSSLADRISTLMEVFTDLPVSVIFKT